MAYKVQFYLTMCYDSGEPVLAYQHKPEKFDTYEEAVAKIEEYSKTTDFLFKIDKFFVPVKENGIV